MVYRKRLIHDSKSKIQTFIMEIICVKRLKKGNYRGRFWYLMNEMIIQKKRDSVENGKCFEVLPSTKKLRKKEKKSYQCQPLLFIFLTILPEFPICNSLPKVASLLFLLTTRQLLGSTSFSFFRSHFTHYF